VAVEICAGLTGHSLALLSDAAHNSTDVIAILLTWGAMRLTLRASNARNTFGYHRAGILVAVINSATLILISLGIFYEAYQRLLAPLEIRSGIMVGVGLIALLVNAGTALLLRPGSEHDLNLRSAFLHLMGDTLSSLGTVVAGVIIFFTGWIWLDPAVSILIGLLILLSAWVILREAIDILLEATPRDINTVDVVRDMKDVPGVLGVHDLHIWSLSRGLRTMSAHIVTEDIPISAAAEIQLRIHEVLAQGYNISHATLQLECISCSPEQLFCEIGEKGRSPTQKTIS
jgi:cobalt-zinc-cadmium efflux system protein